MSPQIGNEIELVLVSLQDIEIWCVKAVVVRKPINRYVEVVYCWCQREKEKEKTSRCAKRRSGFFLLRFQINVDPSKVPMQEQTCRCWPKAVPMLVLFSRVSTWLFVELLATLILLVLNMFIPLLMVFSTYRNVVNFYFSSVALSSSMINSLYMYYIAQSLHSKALSENNCRAIYYLQTSCIAVLGRCSISRSSRSSRMFTDTRNLLIARRDNARKGG